MEAIITAILILLTANVIFNVYLTREVTRLNDIIANFYIRLGSLEQLMTTRYEE